MRPLFKEQLKSGPRWQDCYSLLTQALVGFNLNSVSKFITKSEKDDSDDVSSTMSVLSDPAAESGEKLNELYDPSVDQFFITFGSKAVLITFLQSNFI